MLTIILHRLSSELLPLQTCIEESSDTGLCVSPVPFVLVVILYQLPQMNGKAYLPSFSLCSKYK